MSTVEPIKRPERFTESPPPALPQIDASQTDRASVQYSEHRTKLSTHRTSLSEHRTSLSEYRTDLSTHRTELSTDRTEMSSRRTGLSFQRTRMSAERTLMSVIRTSLSLISFGFTIFQFFQKLHDTNVLAGSAAPARNFGTALVTLGIAMLVLGIIYHVQFMLGLRNERQRMRTSALIRAESAFPVSLTLITAIALLALGVAAVISMLYRVGPFG